MAPTLAPPWSPSAASHPGHVQELVDVDAGALAHHQVRVAVEEPLQRLERVRLEDRVAADAPVAGGPLRTHGAGVRARGTHVGDGRTGPAGPAHPGVHPCLGLLWSRVGHLV